MQSLDKFNTIEKALVIDELTPSGSAFAYTEDGEGAFITPRIMNRMALKEDMLITAHVIPNYEDKRDQTPWRVLFVSDAKMMEEVEPKPVVRDEPSLKDQALKLLTEREDFMSTGDVAKMLGGDVTLVGNALRALNKAGKVVRGDIYMDGSQTRPSWCVWTIDARDLS